MNVPIFKIQDNSDFNLFVEFYSPFYKYPGVKKYDENINVNPLEKENLKKLYEFKLSPYFSTNKNKKLYKERILPKLYMINDLKNRESFNLDEFRSEFKDLPPVWKTFLLHIINSNEFPIYDQNVHRAYNYIKGKGVKEHSKDNEEREDFYFDEYYPFIKDLKDQNKVNLRQIDKALFVFGRILKDKRYLIHLESIHIPSK